jgi:HAE1 family hydrophobic/amphiphilic exporter-1
MTTLTTILGLIPMAFFPGKSSMMIQPIGLTVIGGRPLVFHVYYAVLYSRHVFFYKRAKGKNAIPAEYPYVARDKLSFDQLFE